ncbi:toxin-antitoxin system YwqK family antitoxin [Cerasicoccus arenae]|uniref:Toxin-antitoxin system YwqK family antitoxin n=1 Tax=Cerasicoccus arenae TaxID=424488 RepID=A0A8J3DEC0_9BACT|nr:hypothetical protein [Cerasicoccus arenae]MBK1860095.1 hypothetical protein [Cerasicoccus arenae]GHC14293.1 hypothetical protein GCM10007047_34350 [Cerasicoccus arenae]
MITKFFQILMPVFICCIVVNAEEYGTILRHGEFKIGDDLLCYHDGQLFTGQTLVSEEDEDVEGPRSGKVTLTNWKDGWQDGEKTVYYSSQRVRRYAVVHFKSGIREGVTKYWREDGTIDWVVDYSNGMKNGWSTTYHQNGRIKAKSFYSSDLLNGPVIKWDENGKLLSYYIYSEGDRVQVVHEEARLQTDENLSE